MATEIKVWTVLASRRNAEKILENTTIEELQEAFAPKGVALKIDETLNGPFIAFFNIKSQESMYMTPLEFVEAAKADLWGAQRDYRKVLAEKKKQEEAKKRKPVPDKFKDKPQRKKKKGGGRVIG
jgi:hypothetical protein